MANLKDNYSKNYLKIYLWRSISIVTGFLSMLIVVPHLSDNQELYGIYSFCISLTLYLTYADIGFLRAGQKYAAEQFAKGNRIEEIKIFGFTGAILFLMILPFSVAMFIFSFNPGIIIHGLSSEGQKIASTLFLMIGLLMPVQIILQRLVQSILIIRVKNYISLRVDTIFNLISISSIFYFFSNGRYLIVEFFLFKILLTIVSALIILFTIRKNEKYDFLLLFKSIRITRKYYIILKKLAFSSLFLTLGWIIYYELDMLIIGTWLGPEEVAIYAIGFTFLNFLRTLWNTVFSPYAQRFNHFAGTDSLDKMKLLAAKLIDYTFPLSIFVTLILVIGAKDIVLFWVGKEYKQSITILQLLIVGTGFGFITQPAGFYIIAKTKYKFIYLMAFVLPVIFIACAIIFIPVMGIEAVALSKTLAMLAGFIISYIGLLSLINPLRIIKKWLLTILLISSLIIFFLPNLLNTLFPYPDKNTTQLILLFIILGTIIAVTYFTALISQKEQRKDIKKVLNRVYLRLK